MKIQRLLILAPFAAVAALAQSPSMPQTTVVAGTASTPAIVVGPLTPTLIAAPVNTTTPRPTTIAIGATAGETAVSLDVGFGVRAVAPSRVTVPAGETLRVTAPRLGDDIQYIWTKNGRAIAGATGNVLVIDHVVASDAGVYACLFSTPTTMPGSSQTLVLGVGPTDRLLNLSTRTTITAANPSLVSGFVVSAAREKKLIVRAIGPSLSLFGEATPLQRPALRIFDSNGAPYENGYAYPAVIGGPTYESDLADSLSRAGAFPTPTGSRDAVEMKPFLPGSYTVQVTSADGGGGAVLLEIYEVP